MDIEQKLDLIQQIHREQAENERNLYRKYHYRESFYNDYGMSGNKQSNEKEPISRIASFRLRLWLAIALFLCFFIMEKKDLVFEGIGCIEIIECISNDFITLQPYDKNM